MKEKKIFTTRNLVLMAMFAALSSVLMLFQFPMPFAPDFYKIDFSEVPVLIGAFAIHPVAGIIIELLKNLINLFLDGTTTYFVGELSNFICGVSFVFPCALIYHHKKNKKSAIAGLGVGIITLAVVACLSNLFLILPIYAETMGLKIQTFVDMGSAVNGFVNNLPTFILCTVAPFNIVKGGLNALLTILLYKHVSRLIHQH